MWCATNQLTSTVLKDDIICRVSWPSICLLYATDIVSPHSFDLYCVLMCFLCLLQSVSLRVKRRVGITSQQTACPPQIRNQSLEGHSVYFYPTHGWNDPSSDWSEIEHWPAIVIHKRWPRNRSFSDDLTNILSYRTQSTQQQHHSLYDNSVQ